METIILDPIIMVASLGILVVLMAAVYVVFSFLGGLYRNER